MQAHSCETCVIMFVFTCTLMHTFTSMLVHAFACILMQSFTYMHAPLLSADACMHVIHEYGSITCMFTCRCIKLNGNLKYACLSMHCWAYMHIMCASYTCTSVHDMQPCIYINHQHRHACESMHNHVCKYLYEHWCECMHNMHSHTHMSSTYMAMHAFQIAYA